MADTADSDICEESDDEIASLASENVADFWVCPVTDDAEPRAYKLKTLGRVERKFGLHGECDLALADYGKFTFDAPWCVDDDSSRGLGTLPERDERNGRIPCNTLMMITMRIL